MLPQLQNYLMENWSDLPLGGSQPRSLNFLVQATGISKLCYYIFPNQDPKPRWVAKTRRSPSENELLRQEYSLIRYLRQHGTNFVKDTIPGPLTEVSVAGHHLAIEMYLNGRAMDGLMANARPQAPGLASEYLDIAVDWLLRCQQETPQLRQRLTEQQIHNLFFDPIEGLRSSARLTNQESAYLDRLARRIQHLAGLPLPLVFKHGDFQPGNLLLTDTSVKVIDWEFGVEKALPLLDLFGFLLRAHARLKGREEMDGFLEDYLLDFEAVFFGRGPIARQSADYVARAIQALGIDPEWVSVLFAMFIVTEANKYDALLRRRAERGYVYLLRSRANQIGGSFSDQLARQKNVWLLGYLVTHESRLAFVDASPVETRPPAEISRGTARARLATQEASDL